MTGTNMAITESIQWRVDGKAHSLSRNADCKEVFVYQRGDGLPQFFSAPEDYALAMQIRRMVDRSDFMFVSKQWRSK
jgi:hypothetical protein